MADPFNLQEYDITVAEIHHNLPPSQLYEHAIRKVGPTATLLEWDDHIPSFDEVHAEALKAEKFIAAPALVNS